MTDPQSSTHQTPGEIITRLARHTLPPIEAIRHREPSASVQWCIEHIKENFAAPISLDQMADGARLSKYHFLRKFRNETGLTPCAFLKHYRLTKAMEQLAQTKRAIRAIAQQVGYNDAAAFSRAFLQTVGTQPGKYRQTSQTVRAES